MSAPKLDPVVVLAVAGGAFLLLTEDGKALLDSLIGGKPAPSPAPRAPSAPAVADPVSAAIVTAGGLVQSLMPELQDRDSDTRQGLRNFDRASRRVGSVLTGGLIEDPKKEEKRRKRDAAIAAGRLADMEIFAAKVHGAASRADVVEWVIDTPQTASATSGGSVTGPGIPWHGARIAIYYRGQAKPYEIWVPTEHRDHQLAWIAEPIVRATGSFVQRGGRLANGAPFVFYTDPETGVRVRAFSDANPYAVREQTAGQLFAVKNLPENRAREVSRVRRALPAPYRAAYDQQNLSGA